MPDFRCYCDASNNENISEIHLSREESSHLVAANRARIGQPVTVFNGLGKEWECTLTTADKKRAVLKINSIRTAVKPNYRISIAQCIPKGKLLENIVRKSTEIGTHSIYPIISERSEFRLKKGREESKESKWSTSAIEGAKQSGNPFLPIIHNPIDVSELTSSVREKFDLKLIACLRKDSDSLKNVLSKQSTNPQSAIFLVGPEGDLTEAEIDLAIAAGFIPVTLGPYVLKCETAAISCLSTLRHELS